MKTIIIYLLFISFYCFLNVACAESESITIKSESVTNISGPLAHPVIKIIQIPSSGKVIKIKGDILITNNGEHEAKNLTLKEKVEVKDLINLKIEAYTKIELETGGYLEVGPAKEELWILFQKL